MILKKNLNYVSFDFETTGLDPKKDEAIQFGIVKFDSNFKILDKFSSYIKPNNLDNLSEIVEFTTGIDIKELEKAPMFSDIKDRVLSFFDENSVLIGHNIMFDVNFLNKYIEEIPYKLVFDTYNYSRLFLHFEQSYALEILADKYNFYGKSHDALEDSIMSMELFKLIIKKLEKLIKKFPFLKDIILNSNSVFKSILDIDRENKKVFSIPQKGINIGKTKKISCNFKKISTFPTKSVFNISGIKLADLINFALNGESKVIFSCSSNARVNVLKRKLKENYIPYGTLNLGYIISKDNEKKLLSKDNFEDFEAEYIIKSFSHYNEDLSIIDISNSSDYKVYKFLADKKRGINNNFIVSTHYELFNFIDENGKDSIEDYKIIFLDWYAWPNSLNRVVNKGFDFYELFSKIDILKYINQYYTDISYLEDLENEISIFFGVLFSKIKAFFKGTNNKVELVNLENETKNGINTLKSSFNKISIKIKELKNDDLISYWNIFEEAFTHYTIVEQKVFQNGNLKYIFFPLMENVDINTFNDYLSGLNYYNFTSAEGKNYINLNEILNISYEDDNIFEDWNENIDFKLLLKKLKLHIENKESVYLLSNNKNFSNSLFKLVFNLIKEYNLESDLYVENITGGQGKLLYYLNKRNTNNITIGGVEFLIQTKSKNINYDKIMLLSLGGKNRKNIIEDLKFYL